MGKIEFPGGFNIFLFPSETTILLTFVVIFSVFSTLFVASPASWILEELYGMLVNAPLTVGTHVHPILMAVFAVIALVIHALKPWAVIHREGHVPLSLVRPEIEQEIVHLAASVGITKPFRVLYSDTTSFEIYTFGNVLRNYIVLSSGFLDSYPERNEEFRAILFHELGHIANGDVDRTELALGFLSSFFIVYGAFFLLGLSTLAWRYLIYGPLLDPGFTLDSSLMVSLGFIDEFARGILMILVAGLIIRFAVNLIFQYRELYADARATEYLGSAAPLRKALKRVKIRKIYQQKRFGFISIPEQVFFLRHHPPLEQREEYLRDPMLFLAPRWKTVFITGIALFILNYGIGTMELYYDLHLNLLGMIIPVHIVTLLFGTFLLLPVFFWVLMFGARQKNWNESPLVLSQVFVLGYTFADFIFVNLSMLIPLITKNVLFLGRGETFTYSYGFYGITWPVWFPAIGIIVGELYALVLVAVLLVSGWIIRHLLNCYGMPSLFSRPLLTLYLLPGLISLSVISLFLCSALVPAILLTVGLGAGVSMLDRRYRICPACRAKLPGQFTPSAECPECSHDLGAWIRNT
jgi:Zn-dependent protease with chaperone function